MTADRVACTRGHPIAPGSTITRRDGKVVCRECKHEDNALYYARTRARMASRVPDELDQNDEQWAASIVPGSSRDLARTVTRYRLAIEMATALIKMGRHADALSVLLDVEAPTR